MLDSQRNPFLLWFLYKNAWRMFTKEKHQGMIKFKYLLNMENLPNLPDKDLRVPLCIGQFQF